jgi:hypothetical protein
MKWQDWDWGLIFKGFTAGAALVAVFVSLYVLRLRHWLIPPRLELTLANPEGWPGVVYFLDENNKAARKEVKGIWYHVRVSNKTRWSPVAGVHIFLLSIEAPDASGAFQQVWGEPPTALVWRFEAGNKEPKTIGRPEECDFCHVLRDDTGELRLSPIKEGPAPHMFRAPVALILTLQARGTEADSEPYRLRIDWDGQWSDDQKQMRRHLVVKPV